MIHSAFNRSHLAIKRVASPVALDTAWPIESLLLEVLEYGDYSFRSALLGRYSPSLTCTFFLAEMEAKLVGAAGGLYSLRNPAVAILGPVVVAEAFRRHGIAGCLLEALISELASKGVKALYVGVRQDSPAVQLYKSKGFGTYRGIVMRRLFCPEPEFEARYAGPHDLLHCQELGWEDYAEVMAMVVRPETMVSVDYDEGLFSSRYLPPRRFLSVFPALMKRITGTNGCALTLRLKPDGPLVAMAQVCPSDVIAHRHVGVLDFFIQDAFLPRAQELLREILKRSSARYHKIRCYALAADTAKCQMVEALGLKPIAVIPESVILDHRFIDTMIYEWKAV